MKKKAVIQSEEVLVVTADNVLAEIIAERFSDFDISVRIVTKYDKVLDILEDKIPRAIVVDYDVPKENCFEFLERSYKKHSSLCIALLASFLSFDDLKHARAAGVDFVYIKHHYHPADMVQAIVHATT